MPGHSISTSSRSRVSSKNTESEYDLCESTGTDTDVDTADTSHTEADTSHTKADIASTTLQPGVDPSVSVGVSLDDPIAFDEKGVVVVENDPLSVVEDVVKRKVSLPALPPLLRRNTTRPSRPSPPRRRLSFTSLLPSPRPLALFTRPSLPPPSSFSRNNGDSPNKLTRSLSSGSKGSKLVKHGQNGQHGPRGESGQHANPATQLPQTEAQSEFHNVRAQNAAQFSNPPLSPFGVKRSYTAPPPLGRWPPPPTITKSPCCKDCATSLTAHEGAAAEMGHVKVMSKGLEMKRQRMKRDLEIALGLREQDGSGVSQREVVGSRDGQEQEQEQEGEQEQEQEQNQSTNKSSEAIDTFNSDGECADAISPKTAEGPITPKEPELSRSPPPLRVTNSVDTDLAPLLEGEEFVSTPVSASPSGGVSGEKSTLASNGTVRSSKVVGTTRPSLVTTPTSPARGGWICTPPARSPISPMISSFPVDTPIRDHAERTTSKSFHTHNMSHSDTPKDGNDGNRGSGPTLHRSESSSTFCSLTSSLRRNRPIVTRAMSTGRLATELDENGMVVCLSLHSERVLGPSSWRGGKGR